MNAVIRTVLGDIPPEMLGHCQCHEHIFLAKGRSYEIHHALCIDDPAKSLNELIQYKDAGGSAIVDCQPIGCGRSADVLETISRTSGISIIASTGFHKLLFYPEGHWLFSLGEEDAAALFSGEIELGMHLNSDGDRVNSRCCAKAGIIKTALDSENLTPRYEVLFRAAVSASKATGAPIIVHIENGSNPIALLKFLLSLGMRASKLIFCHLDRAVDDLAVHAEIAKQGVAIEYDTICRPKYHSDEREVQIIKWMIDSGFEDQLLISLDTTRERLASYGGAPGMNYILTAFKEKLTCGGIGEEVFQKLIRCNPARVLAF